MWTIDKQTLSDINAIGWNTSSLFDFFDQTLTLGGRDVLYDFFLHPLNDEKHIQDRQEAITYLAAIQIEGFFDKYMMDDLERYIKLPDELYSSDQFSYYVDKISRNFWSLTYEKERLLIRQSIAEIAQIILHLSAIFAEALGSVRPIGLLRALSETFAERTQGLDMERLQQVSKGKNTLNTVIEYDYRFRNERKNDILEILSIWYTLDALRAVSGSLGEKDLTFARFVKEGETKTLLKIEGLYNLALENPVKNDVEINIYQNIWFLTGANMTGKSTLLKSIGACVYLAHLGFPVPACSMETTLFHGLMTTINLGDNLVAGFSHFFNEVHRLKTIGETLCKHGKMVVILDELFKGTNYQDAYEATLVLVESITGIQDSVFLISSHIAELNTQLQNNEQVAFRFLRTEMHEEKGIAFTYRLVPGVADEKLGMWFLNRENVFGTFSRAKSHKC